MNLFLTQPYLLTLNPASEMNVVWIQRNPVRGVVEYGSGVILFSDLSSFRGGHYLKERIGGK